MAIPFPPPVSLAGALAIGEPFTIKTHYPTVIVECQCPAKTIVAIVYANVAHTCPACKNRFMITDQIQVGVVAMRPDGAEIIS